MNRTKYRRLRSPHYRDNGRLRRRGFEALESRVVLEGTPYISEFMAVNTSTLLSQATNTYEDWIEIYNPGPGAVDLNQWYLTDSRRELHTWRFSQSYILEEDHFLVVFASGQNLVPSGNQLEFHTNFRLGADGEYLGLVRPDGTTVVSEYDPEYPRQTANVSYGVTAETFDVDYFFVPTPNQHNPPPFRSNAFHPSPGFFDEPTRVTLNPAALQPVVRYTLDGRLPTESDSVYNDPILIDTTTVVRAKSYNPGNTGDVFTQTFLFPGDTLAQSHTPVGWPSQWTNNGNVPVTADYGMDPEIVQNPVYAGAAIDSLVSLPTVALTLPQWDLTGSAAGIYANPQQTGAEWEKGATLELIHPDGTKGVNVGVGVRIRGSESRDPANTAKHSFRVAFKAEFGASSLAYPLFPGTRVDRFERLELNGGLHDSWLDPNSRERMRSTMLRAAWLRESQNAMGYDGPSGRFVHLYLDGLYWGIYQLQEQIDADFAGIHFGGSKNDYDVVNSGNLDSGDATVWNRLLSIVSAGSMSDVVYDEIQAVVDLDSFIDVALLKMLAGDAEWGQGNWVAIRNRVQNTPFRFFVDGGERILNEPTDQFWTTAGDSLTTLFHLLRTNGQFRRRFGDRVQQQVLRDGAPLNEAASRERWNSLADSLRPAIIAESARWGDYRRDVSPVNGQPAALYTLNDHWSTETQRVAEQFFPQRIPNLLQQLGSQELLTQIPAPRISPDGGTLRAGTLITLNAPSGTIYYTVHGDDPVLPNGQLHAQAIAYVAPFTLSSDGVVKARAVVGGQVSSLTQATFYRDIPLLITEIQYRASRSSDGSVADDDLFDFLELKNTGTATQSLANLRFTQGIQFDFANSSIHELAPGGRLVIVANRTAFATRYDVNTVPIAGEFSGRLNNSGETITLVGPLGQTIGTVTYDDDWYDLTDGQGFSLTRRQDQVAVMDGSDAEQWRPSQWTGGNPGVADLGVNPGDIIISEALTHSDEVAGDWIELQNTTQRDIDISDWSFSATRGVLGRTTIGRGTVLPARGYLVFTSNSDIEQNFGGRLGMSISKLGERIFLISANPTHGLGGFRIEVEFTYGFNSTSFIRHTNSAGETEYVTGLVRTRGLPNSLPAADRIRNYDVIYLEAVINEIMYHPAPSGDEYIELYNPHHLPVHLDQPYSPAWRFTRGIAYNFPAGASLGPKQYALVVPIEPELFRTKYNVPLDVVIYGPYVGELLNAGELLTVSRAAEDGAFVPYSMSDQVYYNSPGQEWPIEANGRGASLNRVSYRSYGNDRKNWRAGVMGGTPGRANVDLDPSPRVVERALFYNDTVFDQNTVFITPFDDQAIAADRFPLLPGERASITNYSNFYRGITGIVIDIANAPGIPTLNDFAFRVGNDPNPANWTPAQFPSGFSVRPGAGVEQSTRVMITWFEQAIANTWLEVAVLPSARTGLTQVDYHYWGSAIADVGDSNFETGVNSTDVSYIRNNFVNSPDVTNRFDLNRTGTVDAADEAIANANFRSPGQSAVILDLRADLNGNRRIDASDIDTFWETIQNEPTRLSRDLNGDSIVSVADIDFILSRLVRTRFGDANLDGRVDATDFSLWNTNRFHRNSGWSTGDFNGDRLTDGQDFPLWNTNKFQGVEHSIRSVQRGVPRGAVAGAVR